MNFNSVQFLIFLPVITCIYYLLPLKVRHIWLLLCSYYFYMCWNISYSLLLLFSTAVTYICGLGIEWVKRKGFSKNREIYCKKGFVVAGIVLNLGVLFFFKYFNFAVENINSILGHLHFQFLMPSFDILLPVGISFYTFQALGYLIDIYRDEIYAEKNFLKYALFVSFFPQLVAGPIERSKNLLKQLINPEKMRFDNFRDGLLLILWGYFLKVVLADRIAIFVDTIYGNDYADYKGYFIVVATVLFGIQIYCDFSGYSIIAAGSAKILGIHLMENFEAPYLSKSVSEFWRRWHISLSSWFRDYVYIPLGGNRKGKIRKYLNLIITFGISGLWHGASWNYIIWGCLNGVYQIGGDLIQPLREKAVHILGLNRESIGHKAVQMLCTFTCIQFSWIFFRARWVKNAFIMIRNMFGENNLWIFFDGSLYECGLSHRNFNFMIVCIFILLGIDICKYKKIKIREIIAKQDPWCQILIITFSIVIILLTGIWGSSYDASKFIYFQF